MNLWFVKCRFTVLEKKKAVGKDAPGSFRAWEEEGVAGAASAKQEPVVDYFDFTST